MSVDKNRLASIIESLIFVSEEPLAKRKIKNLLEGVPAGDIDEAMEIVKEKYAGPHRGVLLEEVAEGFQFRTSLDNSEWVKMLIEFNPAKLSKASLETLAIIAYNQPCTKHDVDAIRGVDSSSPFSALMEKNLIRILGRMEGVGRPLIYGTTSEFLEVFNLKSLDDLPTLKEVTESEFIDPERFDADLARHALEERQPSEDEDEETESGRPTAKSYDDPSDD